MQCPKCKNEISAKSLKCEKCGTRVATVCKTCGAINPIRAIECKSCHTALLKICTECGSANLPDAVFCRKCGVEFIHGSSIPKKKSQNNLNVEYKAETYSQQKAKTCLLESIKDADTSIITLNGESGCGKNLILRYVINELKNAKLVWLMGTCTQITQLSPFGYFQDLLLNFFNINNFCPDTLSSKKIQ